MAPSLEGLKTEGVIGSLELSELEEFVEFQRLIIPRFSSLWAASHFLDPISTAITINAMK
jgi:hypothetical protein